MKPIIILPPKTMSAADIAALRKNDLCVVVAKDPSKVKFVDPIPAASNRTQIENAAIKLSRCLLNGQWSGGMSTLGQSDFAKLFVDILTIGTPLDAKGTIEEREQQYFDQVKWDEIARLARAEAKAEREAKKKAALAPKT